MDLLIDLSADRHIAIRDRGVPYRFTLNRVTADQWCHYFDGIVSTSEARGNSTINTLDTNSAMLDLVAELLVSAEGYNTGSGPAVTDIEGWKAKIPLSHRLAIAQVLTKVEPCRTDEEGNAIVLGCESVALEGLWNAGDDGAMRLHTPLIHNFNTPTFEHERRFLRDSSRSKVVGGSRSGKTIWSGVQRTLIAIYDELIDSVAGYTSLGGLSSPAAIAQSMDAYHKVVAARQLFTALAIPDEAV